MSRIIIAMPAVHPSHRAPALLTCITCRYDLRGLPPAGRCPECGTYVAVSAVTMRLDRLPLVWLMQREAASRKLERTFRFPMILGAIALAIGVLLAPTFGPPASVPAGALAFVIVIVLPMALTIGIAGMAAATPEPRWTPRLEPWRRRTAFVAAAACAGWLLPVFFVFCAPRLSLLLLWAELAAIGVLSDSYLRYLAALARIGSRPRLAERYRRETALAIPIVGLWAAMNGALSLVLWSPALPPWWFTVVGSPELVLTLWCVVTGVFFIWLYRLGVLQRHVTAALRHARRRAANVSALP